MKGCENGMTKFYYQVYYPEMEEYYVTDTVEIETGDDILPGTLSRAIDDAMNKIDDEKHDDRLEKADAIFNEVCKMLGGSWHYLNITGVLEVR